MLTYICLMWIGITLNAPIWYYILIFLSASCKLAGALASVMKGD